MEGPQRWATALPRDRSDRRRALALPALLIAIASFGVVRSATANQSSWQGASFGMFATYDNRSSRTLEVLIGTSAGDERAALPEELRRAGVRLLVVPTDATAGDLARDVLRHLDDPSIDRVTVSVDRLVIDRRSDDQLTFTTRAIARGTAHR